MEKLLDNIVSFVASLPTIVIALVIIAIILNLLGVTIKGIIKTIVASFVMSVVLGAFGISLPSFPQIISFLVSMFKHLEVVVDAIFK